MADITEYDIKIKFSESGAEKTANDIKDVKSNIDILKSAVKGLGIGVALKKVTDSIGSMINKTSDYIETVNLFRASMGSAANTAQQFIDKAEQILGLDPGKLMDSISSFYNMADGMGIASDRAYTMSQNLTQLAGDLSSFANISFEDAQKKLMSGFAGQVLPLRRYGIALDQASLQERAYSLGLQQKVTEMTRAQKSELIYYQIMTATQKMQGDLGRTLDSPANALRLMKTEFNKLAREIGMVFIPVALKIIPVIIAITEVILDGVKAIAKFFNIDIGDYTASTDGVGTYLQGIGDDIGGIGDAADTTTKKLNKMLMPFDELNNITFNTGTGSASGLGGIGAGGGGLGIDLPEYDMFSNVSTKIREEVDKIKQKIEGILPILLTIGAIIAGWKVASEVSNFFKALKNFDPTTLAIAAGLMLTITGIQLFYNSMKNILRGDLTAENLLKGLAGAGITGLGIGIIGTAFGLSLLPVTLTVGITLALVLVGTYLFNWESKNLYKPLAEELGMDWDGASFTKKLSMMLDFDLQSRGLKTGKIQEARDKGQTPGEEIAFRSPLQVIVSSFGTSDYSRYLKNTIGGFFTEIAKTISTEWGTLKGTFRGIRNFFENDLPNNIDTWFSNIFKTVARLLGIEGGGDSTKFTGFGEKVTKGFKAGLTGNLNELWNAVFGEEGIFPTLIKKVKGLFGIEDGDSTKFKEFGKNIIAGFFKGLTGKWGENEGSVLGKEGIFPKIIEKVKNLFGIHSPSTVFESIGKNLIQGLINGIQSIWGTLTEKFNNIKNLTNFQWSLPHLKTPHMYWSTQRAPDWAAKILSALNLPTDIPKLNVSWYAQGGFPQTGQLFVANEAGPELIGNIGNRTAVANQDQIVQAVSKGVYDAVVSAMSQRNSDSNPYIVVNVGDEQMYKGYGTFRNQQSNMYGVNIG